MRGVLQLCAVLGLLRRASTVPAGHPTDSHGPSAALRAHDCSAGKLQIDCIGPSEADSVYCTVSERRKITHRGRLRLSGWVAGRPAPPFEGALSLVKELELSDTSLSSAGQLKLCYNQLPAVPLSLLSQMPNLKGLVMNDNQISHLRRHHLQNLPCLEYLAMAENGLRRVEKDALPTSLKHVGLADNKLRTLNGAVRHLENMSWLLVSKNRLTSLAGELPVGGGMLDSLFASGNQLTSLDGVQDASRLQSLYLGSNQLRSVGRLRLPLLERLNLTFNRIRAVSVEQLAGLPALKELSLGGNQLSEVEPILTVLPALSKLDISHNQLSSIAELTPANQQGSVTSHRLRELDAAANRITTVGQLKLPKLRKLNLANNQLTQVSEADFAGMASLEELVLSGNRLRRVGHLLKVLPALTKADFSSNSITSVSLLSPQEQVPHESKPRQVSLQTLLLNNNSLRLLDVSLYRLPALCVLDVRNNDISRLRWHHHQVWRCHLQYRKLRIHGNPVDCADPEVRRSLKQVALSFRLDVPPCAGVGEPQEVAPPPGSG